MKQPQLEFYVLGKEVTAFSTTRHGGYSTGRPGSAACQSENYAAFNINRYCGDDEEHVRRNREALCTLLGISDDRLIMPRQVHETKVAKIDEALLSLSEKQKQETLDGYDALMTNLSGVCIGVSTADCIPVLLYDEAHHAVCAVHAGWRGTVKRIVEKAVGAMTEAYGTQPRQLVAQTGPGIHLDSFEVDDEVYEAFQKEGFEMEHISIKKEKWHIDLPECNRLQLIASGLLPQNIKVSPVCTYQQSADYFSARRLGINSGRIFTGIIIDNR